MPINILAIDPGPVESAYVLMDEDYKPIEFGKVDNESLRDIISHDIRERGMCDLHCIGKVVIEMVASYGMAVGKEVFDTCVWIGRFYEISNLGLNPTLIYRKDVKLNLCGQTKAKDSNIRQALIDRFGVVGTKKNKGWFYGVSKDVWQAYALGTSYLDMLKRGEIT